MAINTFREMFKNSNFYIFFKCDTINLYTKVIM